MNEGEWHWRRGVLGTAQFLAACILHLSSMSPTSSFEHHPFSGPLIVIQTARQTMDYVIGLPLLFFLGVGISAPAFRFHIGTVILAFLSGLGWVSLSMWAAAVASC